MIIIIFFYEILGQTTSCPEVVYSALVQAAAEEEITQVSNKIISRVSVYIFSYLKEQKTLDVRFGESSSLWSQCKRKCTK